MVAFERWSFCCLLLMLWIGHEEIELQWKYFPGLVDKVLLFWPRMGTHVLKDIIGPGG